MASVIYYIILLHQKAQSFSLGIYHPYLRDRETTKQISSGLEENQFFINTSNPFLSNNSRYFYNYFPEKRNRPKQESSAHIFMDFRITIFSFRLMVQCISERNNSKRQRKATRSLESLGISGYSKPPHCLGHRNQDSKL